MSIKKALVLLFLAIFLCLGALIVTMYTSSYRSNRMILRTGALVKTALLEKSSSASANLPSLGATFLLYGKLMKEQLTEQDYVPRQCTYGPLTINYFSPYDLSLLVHEVFVRNVYAFTNTKPNPVIIDCGSNIGISILFFKSLYPEAKIIGFEAHPETFKTLEKNITDNHLHNVTVHHVALYDNRGTVQFARSANAPGHPGMKIDTQQSDGITVDAVCLSDYIDCKVDFVKIDIEGAEGAVMRDLAFNKKLELIDQMIIEYHDNGNPNNDLTEILDYLDEDNFKYMIHSEVTVPFVQGPNAGMMIYAWRNK